MRRYRPGTCAAVLTIPLAAAACSESLPTGAPLVVQAELLHWPSLEPVGQPYEVSVLTEDTVLVRVTLDGKQVIGPAVDWSSADEGTVGVRSVAPTVAGQSGTGTAPLLGIVEGRRLSGGATQTATTSLTATVIHGGIEPLQVRLDAIVVHLVPRKATDRGSQTPESLEARWPEQLAVATRDTVTLSLMDHRGRAVTGIDVRWQSGDAAVLRVQGLARETGDSIYRAVVSGLREGVADIVFTAGLPGFGTDEVRHSVAVRLLDVIALDWPETLTVTRPDTLRAVVTDVEGVMVENPEVRWESSDENALQLVSLSSIGDTLRTLATPRIPGASVLVSLITDEVGFQESAHQASLRVLPIGLNQWSGADESQGWPAQLAISEATRVGVELLDKDGQPLEEEEVNRLRLQWRSSDDDVMRVARDDPNDERSAVLTGRSVGSALLTLSLSQGGFLFQESTAEIAVEPVALEPVSWPDTVSVRDSLLLSIELEGSGFGNLDTLTVSWTSEPAIAVFEPLPYVSGSNVVSAVTRPTARGAVSITVEVGRPGVLTRAQVTGSIQIMERWINVAAGGHRTCAVNANREVYCWGEGPLGDGQLSSNAVPRRVFSFLQAPADLDSDLTDGRATLSVGRNHACVLVLNGVPLCWGRNGAGQLGNGTTTDQLLADRVLLGSPATSISAGTEHTCAVTPTGTYCWGRGDDGQLGVDTIGVPCTMLDEPAREFWANATSCLDRGTAAVFTRIDTMSVPPLEPFVTDTIFLDLVNVTAGNTFSCGIDVSGSGFCWGGNDAGGLGRPTPEINFRGAMRSLELLPDALGVLGEPPLQMVSASDGADWWSTQNRYNFGQHVCGISGGVPYCWGQNNVGQAGPQVTDPTCGLLPQFNGDEPGVRGVAVPCSGSPTAVGGAPPLVMVEVGAKHSCGLTSVGDVYCWGANVFGQLGRDVVPDPSCEDIGKDIALDADWEGEAMPVSCSRIPGPLAGSQGFSTVTSGAHHTCALRKVDGAIYCWGRNQAGQLGTGGMGGDGPQPRRVVEPRP